MHFDCLVIGSGPAGLYAALSCAKKGYSTVIVENRSWGGTGFSNGCLPVKKILDRIKVFRKYNSIFHHQQFGEFPESGRILFNDRTYGRRIEVKVKERLQEAGVETLYGNGFFVSERVFNIEGKIIQADRILIATGTSPSSPEGIPLDGDRIISHREAVVLDKLPEEMIIIGGNVEGIEFATLFSSLGVKVVVVEQEWEILSGNDRDLVLPLLTDLENHGVVLKTGVKIVSSEVNRDMVELKTEEGEAFVTEKVLVTGVRAPNFPRGLDRAGVHYLRWGIPVNKKLETNVSGIFALGDINGLHGMAHIAIQQGVFITEGFDGKTVPQDYSALPRAVFSLPEIAGAGKQEWELLEAGMEYRTVSFDLKDSWRGFSRDIDSGFIKLIFDMNEQLSGIWMTGENASTVMSASGLLLKKRISKREILENLFIHPTLGEGILEGAFLL